MTNIINVTLDQSVSPPVLDVEDHGGHRVNPSKDTQTITWQLVGQLTQGAFVRMDDPEPGFEWEAPGPPPGIFGTPEVQGPGSRTLTITDTHPGPQSAGTWIYRLRVAYQGTVYSTTVGGTLTATSNNPVIINR